MDLILKFYDDLVFTPYVYPTYWDVEWWLRQYISLFVVVTIHSYVLYLAMAGLSYVFIFDKKLLKHPKLLKVNTKKFLTSIIQSFLLFIIGITFRWEPTGTNNAG